jgi:hypothetical protein
VDREGLLDTAWTGAAECPLSLPRTSGEVVRSEPDWFVRRDGSLFPVSYVSVPLGLA